MGFGVFLFWTIIWGGVGGVAPMFLPESRNRNIGKIVLITTAVCCYTMWLTTYLAQTNPLFGPKVSNITLAIIKRSWT